MARERMPAQHLLQRRHVEDVAQDLAVGLQDDRERAVAAGHGQQVGGALALHPQRRALAGPPSRQQQRARSVLPEVGGEQRRPAQRAHQDVVDLVRAEHEQLVGGRLRRIGQAQGNAVIGPDRLHRTPLLGQPRLDGHRPRGVDAAAERRQQAQPPVAKLVAEALDHQLAIGGQGAGRLALLAEVGDQVACGQLVQGVVVAQPCRGGIGLHRLELAQEGADRPPQLDRPANPIALPEGHLAGLAGGGRHEHAIRLDLLDPPRAGAQQEDLADPRFVDHLLVQLADAPALAALVAGQEDAVQAAIRDGAARGDRHHPRVVAAGDGVGGAIPDHARPQLRELVGGVSAGKHVQHTFQLLARQVAERVGAGHQRVQLVHRPAAFRANRHQLLGEHVQRVAGDAGLLDRPVQHAPHDHGRLQQVAAVLREDLAGRRLADLVPARPIRCSPAATDGGASIWITRSMAPMSIPSSRLEVATSAGRRPAFNASSISRRCSRAMLP